jgi:Domain of unknown function (DUF4932)
MCSIGFGQKLQKPYENFGKYFGAAAYELAGKSLDTLLALEPNNNYWLLDKVELETEMGHLETANAWLAKLIKNGYCDLQHLQQDENLQKLRQTDAFKQLFATLESRLATYKLAENDQKMTVQIPPMLECYAIMLYLGNPAHTLINSKQNHAYFKEIDAYFAPYKRHPLVLELACRYPSNPNDWINNLRGHHNLRTLYVYDSLNIQTVKRFPIELDVELAKLVHDFGVESKFMDFYAANAEFYYAMRKILYTNYSFGSQVIPFFNKNFDLKINRFNVYFSPIYGGWQHGPTVRMGHYIECFYFGGIMYTNTKQFYYPTENLLFTLLTEFDHTTVNELTAHFMGQFKPLKDKLPLLNSKEKGGYYSLEATLNEYITWAFALQYFYENTPNEYANLEKGIVSNMEKNRGFVKFGSFMDFYKTYINHRDKYPKMRDFYPEIVKWVGQL